MQILPRFFPKNIDELNLQIDCFLLDGRKSKMTKSLVNHVETMYLHDKHCFQVCAVHALRLLNNPLLIDWSIPNDVSIDAFPPSRPVINSGA